MFTTTYWFILDGGPSPGILSDFLAPLRSVFYYFDIKHLPQFQHCRYRDMLDQLSPKPLYTQGTALGTTCY